MNNTLKAAIVLTMVALTILIVFFRSAVNQSKTSGEQDHSNAENKTIGLVLNADQVKRIGQYLRRLGPAADFSPVAGYRLSNIQYLGWAKKTKTVTQSRTDLEFQELILQVSWKSKNGNRFLLVFLRSFENSQWKDWQLARQRVPFVLDSQLFDSMPDPDQIVTFLRNTNFGNFEFKEGVSVKNVVSFVDDMVIVAALESKLDQSEINTKRRKLELSTGYR